MINIKDIKVYYLEYPLINSINTSFGLMNSRPAIILQVEDSNKNIGYGEVWCNFPSNGAKYRFELIKNIFIPFLQGKTFVDPNNFIKLISEKLKTIFVQSGDMGSFNNICAGFDCAIWDLFAKYKSTPLHKILNKDSKNSISLYASGINPSESIPKINEARELGIKSFKVKIGFNSGLDYGLMDLLYKEIKNDELIMVDVNQGWTLNNAIKYMKNINNNKIKWIEEPISALSSYEDWAIIKNSTKNKIALGENINSQSKMIELSNKLDIDFIQPDITKYGGISLIIDLKKHIKNEKICLHFLGSGVGLLTSAHVLASIDSNSLLEYDINYNPLRNNIFMHDIKVINGKIFFTKNYGIDYVLNHDFVNKYLVSTNV